MQRGQLGQLAARARAASGSKEGSCLRRSPHLKSPAQPNSAKKSVTSSSIDVDPAKLTWASKRGDFWAAGGKGASQCRAGQGGMAAAYQPRPRSLLAPPTTVATNDLGRRHIGTCQMRGASMSAERCSSRRPSGVGVQACTWVQCATCCANCGNSASWRRSPRPQRLGQEVGQPASVVSRGESPFSNGRLGGAGNAVRTRMA